MSNTQPPEQSTLTITLPHSPTKTEIRRLCEIAAHTQREGWLYNPHTRGSLEDDEDLHRLLKCDLLEYGQRAGQLDRYRYRATEAGIAAAEPFQAIYEIGSWPRPESPDIRVTGVVSMWKEMHADGTVMIHTRMEGRDANEVLERLKKNITPSGGDTA